MQLKLPQKWSEIPCFKTDTQVYLVIKEHLYSFTPFEVQAVKTLPQAIRCTTSYYSKSTIYYSNYAGIGSLHVGELACLALVTGRNSSTRVAQTLS
jgi:hypothetical protein